MTRKQLSDCIPATNFRYENTYMGILNPYFPIQIRVIEPKNIATCAFLSTHTNQTYAPVTSWTTALICIIIGWYYNMEILLLDFKGAYLHTHRPKTHPVYLAKIPGIDVPEGKMIYLNKGLYGTVDAGNLWRQTVDQQNPLWDARQCKNTTKLTPCELFHD